ncbi:MAG TPA: HD domain-containing protein [Bacteroidetes bacterium]|nr:HD domain-containing protein [Bacteroidota bacterium]
MPLPPCGDKQHSRLHNYLSYKTLEQTAIFTVESSAAKGKIVNDPVYGFIRIPAGLVFELTEHPYVQRLRRIRQLGLTGFVYPGANHTRFQHALGALHLMSQAIQSIRSKGTPVTPAEEEAVSTAILLHDIGHGPFSHALENSLMEGIRHEDLSILLMEKLNRDLDNRLKTALRIFRNRYPKKFLFQLVSGQLDMDRMDYLRRDSFFTGVTEGTIGSDRIIKMLNVVNDQLVVEIKGIYSIEKFLIARRLMYWQVYFHKTVIVAEQLLLKLLQRVRELSNRGIRVFATPSLDFFIRGKIEKKDVCPWTGSEYQLEIIKHFTGLDDNDLLASAKVWQHHPDPVLSELSRRLITRKLFAIEMQPGPFERGKTETLLKKAGRQWDLNRNDSRYLVFTGSISNHAYSAHDEQIKILLKNGKTADVTAVSEMLGTDVLSKRVRKYYLCYPKEIRT